MTPLARVLVAISACAEAVEARSPSAIVWFAVVMATTAALGDEDRARCVVALRELAAQMRASRAPSVCAIPVVTAARERVIEEGAAN